MTDVSNVPAPDSPIRLWGRWAAISGGLLALLVLIVLPPMVAPPWRGILMEGFSAVCHQLPARSPHIHGTALAVCHRCLGIYGGLALGALLAPVIPQWAGTIHTYTRYALLGALIPLGADWLAGVLNLWTNTPISRVATGGLVGVVAGLLVVHRLTRPASLTRPAASAPPIRIRASVQGRARVQTCARVVSERAAQYLGRPSLYP